MPDDIGRVPKVSVRLPSFNHGRYVGECLRSVFAQTFQDFEVVITDDGSTDDTVAVIRSFDDPRIRLEVFPENRGATCAIADCCCRCRGEYVANLCSDDAWEPDKLQRQVDFLDAHLEFDAVLTRVTLVDERGRPLTGTGRRYQKVFDAPDASREKWLRRFFLEGNALCMPSALIRRDIYEAMGWQDLRMASLSDFDFWVRFSFGHHFHILDERLTRFRLRTRGANASGETAGNFRRMRFEYRQVLGNYLGIDSIEELSAIFPECARFGTPVAEAIPYFLARIALDQKGDFRQLWGLETMYRFLGDAENAALVERLYGFSYRDLHRLSAEVDAAGIETRAMLRMRMGRLRRTAGRLASAPMRVLRALLVRQGEG